MLRVSVEFYFSPNVLHIDFCTIILTRFRSEHKNRIFSFAGHNFVHTCTSLASFPGSCLVKIDPGTPIQTPASAMVIAYISGGANHAGCLAPP